MQKTALWDPDRSGGKLFYEAGVSDAYSQIQVIFKINNTWFSCWAWGASEAIGENRQVETTAREVCTL